MLKVSHSFLLPTTLHRALAVEIALVAWLSMVAVTSAEETSDANSNEAPKRAAPDSVAALVVSVTSCAALHVVSMRALTDLGHTANAETARTRARADQVTAMYLLAQERIAMGGAPQPLASFEPYVQQLMAGSLERMAAIISSGDVARFRNEEEFCASLLPLENEVAAKLSAH
jgi:hypothetical protein